MRRGRRIANKVVGFAVFVVMTTLVLLQPEVQTAWPRFTQIFTQKTVVPIIEKVDESPSVTFEDVNKGSNPQVLAAASSVMFWDESHYDLDCYQLASVNGCDRAKGGKTIVLRNLMFSKQHHGLQFFDGTSTSVTLIKEEIEGYNPKTGKPIWKVTDRSEPFRYCTGPEYESLSMISLGPISWPTTLMGQEISTYRATINGQDTQYAVIDPTGKLFTDFQPDDIERFCSQSDSQEQYALRTGDTYNAKLPGFNGGDSLMYGILALCKLTGPNKAERTRLIEELWKSEDQGVQTVTAMVEVENNLGMVDTKFQELINKEGQLYGVVSKTEHIGMFAWQTKGARYARISNSTAASKLLSNILLPPHEVIDVVKEPENRDIKPGDQYSSTIINGPAITLFRQLESSKPTIVGALSGGVYYMSDKVLSDSNNLSILSWNPQKQDNQTFFCKTKVGGKDYLKRCPVVKSIGGCSSEGFAQTDVRLRQLNLAAVNDTQRFATNTEDPEVARTTTRTEYMLDKRTQAPDTLIERATTDEIIWATQKGSVVCLPEVKKRIDQQATKLSEEEMKRLNARMSRVQFKDQAILVSPVRVNYRAWALFDVDKGVQAACKAWAAANHHPAAGSRVPNKGQCDAMDPDNNGYNAIPVQKWSNDKFIMRPALISFNIATYFRGLDILAPTDERYLNFKEDLKTQLASHEIYEYEGIKADCGTDANGVFQYWLCTESDNKLLPKCDDGSNGGLQEVQL